MNKASYPWGVRSINKCHQCGATSYKPVIKRDDQGVMRPSGTYQCTGCRLEFTSIAAWRNGQVDQIGAEGGKWVSDSMQGVASSGNG